MKKEKSASQRSWWFLSLLVLWTLSRSLFAQQEAPTGGEEQFTPKPPTLQLQVQLSPKESLLYWWTIDLAGEQPLTSPKVLDLSKPSPQLPTIKPHQYEKLYLWLYHPGQNLLFRWEEDLQKPPPSLQVQERDFNIVPLLKLRLITQGRPLASGWVVLEDQQKVRHSALLLPSSLGDLLLPRVALGRAVVEIHYGEDRTARLEVDVTSGKAGEPPLVEIPVVGGPALEVKAPSAQQESSSPKPSTPAPPSPFLGFLFSLGLIATFGLVLYSLVRFRIIHIESLLKRLGVSESQAPSVDFLQKAPEPVTVAPGHCPFCGQPKDPITGACACSPPKQAARFPGGAPPGQVRLIGVTGPALNRQFLLDRPEMTIGRDPSSDIPLVDDPTVSRRHCKISIRGGEIHLQDEGSSNGTFVNGIRITSTLLKPGDEIVIGQSRFRLE